MPSNASSAFLTHLSGETTFLATLWEVTRRDGQVFRFTDHDQNITYSGNTYITGIGYNRSAIEDKFDLSVDNMNITGILDTTYIDRDDVRGGLFDRAHVVITIINWKDPTQAGAVKRSGWFGEVKQNNNGEFETELRGLTQALSERFAETYTPGCRVDLGSQKCGIPLVLSEFSRAHETTYALGNYVSIPDIHDLVFECTTAGTSAASGSYDESDFEYAVSGGTITDGEAVWTARAVFHAQFVVTAVTSRAQFSADLIPTTGRWNSDGAYFDGGTITFDYGNNDAVSLEISSFDFDSDDAGGNITLFLRAPFSVETGDTGTIFPGCSKGIGVCNSRFSNSVNFRGFPHVPGDKYLKDYPDTK